MMYWKHLSNLFVKWRDNKDVHFLSTNGTYKQQWKVNNNIQKLDVPQPQLVRDYKKYTSGVDRSDQMINKYNSLRKNRHILENYMLSFIGYYTC